MRQFLLVLIILVGVKGMAQELPGKRLSDEQIDRMALHNLSIAESEPNLGPMGFRSSDIKPFVEWDTTGYIIMSDDDFYGIAKNMKRTLAENLPSDVTLVVYTQSTSKSYQNDLSKYYSQFIPKERLVILEVPSSGTSDFWSRDNTPVPVWQDGNFSLVDAQYYYNFEPDQFLNKIFGGTFYSHNYFYEGGNFIANSKGDCLVVNRNRSYPGGVSDTGSIPDSLFETRYGCKRLIRFKHLKGIGHSDEVVKFMTDEIVLTDTEEYVETLEEAGFKVVLVPEPERNYETYINSLIVNDTIFVPIFGESNDQKALQIYEDLNLGYKVVPVQSRQLSTRGQGSIHCITMNYPPVPLSELKRTLNK